MTRKPDWKLHLMQYMAECARRPFEVGQHDCALFWAGGIDAMTGIDPAADWRGKYKTVAGGLRLLKRAGFADHIAVAASKFEEIPIAFAAPGDLAVIPAEDGGLAAAGIVQGEGIYTLGQGGLAVMPLLSATTAFRVI